MLSRKIGIDLGTSAVRMYVKGEGIVVNEPSDTSLQRDSARTLHQLIGKAKGRPRLFKPEVIVSVPSAVTSTQRRALTEAAISAGARQVWLIDEPLAAAMGAGLPIGEVRACGICEIGAGTTEVAVISLSGIVVANSIPVGGHSLDEAIVAYLKRRHGIAITEHTAEAIKVAVGSALPMEEPLLHVIEGVQISSNDIAEAVQEPLRHIVDAIRAVLAEAPAKLVVDIRERGLVLSGGAASCEGSPGSSHRTPELFPPSPTTRRPRSCAEQGSRWTTSKSSGATRVT